ncbi:MAG: adenosylcobinamide amidohydrolase [Methanobrevibacter thaueri]|jgi:adenosylcobinamide amidohydrolase|uniref:adenosylcobinamide amidohydrolase n=1 Tax=Methanobrevibacter thaueri TaxID=190975 RepID=UPI0026EF29FE|nr:adenosylcobinamide amidohydrolase [Methanobrevibacter thaueri]MBE6495514.1 adenosylcobinamide amidohydrolase [Methanobrevibacter thaueri]
MYSNRLIFKTSTDDKIYYLKDTILIDFGVNRNGISTSELNSGTNDLYKTAFNQHLSQEKIDYLVNHDVHDYLINECELLGIDSNYSTGLVTLAEMKNVSIVTKSFRNVEVTAIVTAGVRTNATRAGDPASYWEENGEFHLGTINIILLTNVCLEKSTLTEAFMTATEAKTVALNDLRIPSQYSNGYATGTGTDGVAIFSNTDSEDIITNAGKHSKLGELIAATIIEAIPKAISKQVWITKKSQSNALVRLNRFTLDINEFYDSLDCDKFEFIKQLRIDAKKQENVVITTSVLNLIDEAENNLVKKQDAYDLAMKIKENCNSYPIRTLLEYWINYFILIVQEYHDLF